MGGYILTNNIFAWVSKHPEAAVGVAGLIGGIFIFFLNSIIKILNDYVVKSA
jgi:hypothetical protein